MRLFAGRRNLILALLAAIVVVAALLWRIGVDNSRADPTVRRASMALADWPVGAPPVRVLLISDMHVGNASTDAARLARVAKIANRAKPDLVIAAGDFVARAEHARGEQAKVLRDAFAQIRAPLGTVAVLGNHDNWTSPKEIRRSLTAAGVTVIENTAIRRGPLLIGGAGDSVSGHTQMGPVFNALKRLEADKPGARLYVGHSPDIVTWIPRGALLLSGHTHCGQIVLPLVGPVVRVSEPFGNRFICGVVHDRGKTVVVTAGIGTSTLPLRFGAPPDMWLITVGPPPGRKEAPKPSSPAP